MGYAALGAMFYFLIAFIIVWYVGQLCSVIGIVFSCITISNSNKYVQTKGLGNFKTTKKYRVASLVFIIISCLIIVLWTVFFIWVGIESNEYSNADDEVIEMLSIIFSEGIPMLAIHIASLITGIIAQVKFSPANALYEDILCGRVKAPTPPVTPAYQNPYQQQYYRGGYNQGQPNQYGYVQPNQQNYQQPNQYGYVQPNRQNYQQPNQYGYVQPNQQNSQQPNQYGYVQPNRQNYQQPNQYGYVQPNQYGNQQTNQQNGQQPNGGYYTTQAPQSSAVPPMIQDDQPKSGQDGNAVTNGGEENTVICPACGKSNKPNYKFCAYCGNRIQ